MNTLKGITSDRHAKAFALGLTLLISTLCFTPGAWSYETYLHVQVSDPSTWGEPSYTLSETVEDQIAASHSVSYEGRKEPQWGGALAAKSSASYSLMTGEVKFLAGAMGYMADAFTGFSMKDKIYPVWDVSGRADPIQIQVIWSVEGSYDVYSWYDPSGSVMWSWDGELWIKGGQPFNYSAYASFYYNVDGGYTYSTPWSQFNLLDGHESWTQTFMFDPTANSYITIGESLGAWFQTFNSQKAVADFSNTGTIQVILPEGAHFTSESGVFLTGENGGNGGENPVPVPLTVILLGSGLVGLFAVRRRF